MNVFYFCLWFCIRQSSSAWFGHCYTFFYPWAHSRNPPRGRERHSPPGFCRVTKHLSAISPRGGSREESRAYPRAPVSHKRARTDVQQWPIEDVCKTWAFLVRFVLSLSLIRQRLRSKVVEFVCVRANTTAASFDSLVGPDAAFTVWEGLLKMVECVDQTFWLGLAVKMSLEMSAGFKRRVLMRTRRFPLCSCGLWSPASCERSHRKACAGNLLSEPDGALEDDSTLKLRYIFRRSLVFQLRPGVWTMVLEVWICLRFSKGLAKVWVPCKKADTLSSPKSILSYASLV